MLGKTAGGLYWMFRNLERAENTARLIEAGFRIALTRSTDAALEWQSVILTTASTAAFTRKYDVYDAENVIDFLLRDQNNPNSVMSVIGFARDNAKTVRTALTSEVWLAVNETWMVLRELLRRKVKVKDLPQVLSAIRHQSELVRGALHSTMLRNDIFDFCQLGNYIERLDNTARIIDVKYYTLLPDAASVGGRLDSVQWETILRSASARRAFRWSVDGDFTGPAIANFLIFDDRMPRSIAFCMRQITKSLVRLSQDHGEDICPSCSQAKQMQSNLESHDMEAIYSIGLHEFLDKIQIEAARLSLQIGEDFRFNPAPAPAPDAPLPKEFAVSRQEQS